MLLSKIGSFPVERPYFSTDTPISPQLNIGRHDKGQVFQWSLIKQPINPIFKAFQRPEITQIYGPNSQIIFFLI